eukprot:TRINITY_DN44978_c0_g1_i1.p1 TRINITY_DN44978_c0_g1~~TRINITY_DN44978_c0_g1_i1.p1  ORF type:complete len:617 (-),score=92.27 TRINITY_DN44978_c0_g1_i1:36-1886(-)
MDRVAVISRHVTSAALDSNQVNVPLGAAGQPAFGSAVAEQKRTREAFRRAATAYNAGIERLRVYGELPSITVYELLLAEPQGARARNLDRLLNAAEANGSLAALDLLPGPWKDAKTREDKIELLHVNQLAQQYGIHTQLYAEYQQRYGDHGLSSNIVVPCVFVHSDVSKVVPGSPDNTWSGDMLRVGCRVIIAHPDDAERIARIHIRKEPNFGGFMDSIISTTDNEHWREQRKHFSEAFLPLSSLAQILPVSLARAKACTARLEQLATKSSAVDMSEFLLHEAQAQLQLALLGAPESLMNATNEDLRKTFMLNPAVQPGALSKAMRALMKIAQEDRSLALPTDGCAVRGPLSRALQTGGFAPATDYGNMMLILFAGHDTTGHTMTWLLFELARNPSIQLSVQQEIDAFFINLGDRDPAYQDLCTLSLLDRCITETLRMWPAVANGTFRQLHFQEQVTGASNNQVALPKGTLVNIVNWSRHRNPQLWGQDADRFNPFREFTAQELAHVGCPMAATNPQSARFSPFAHNPRSCLGKNFAKMEMRLILSYLLHKFTFSLAPPYDTLHETHLTAASTDPKTFRGVNRAGTMGPMDLEKGGSVSADEPYLIAMKLNVSSRS